MKASCLLLWSTVIDFVLIVVSNNSVTVKIGTINLWNVMFNWELRLEHIASIIKENEIDIIAFQEVRFKTPKGTHAASQLDRVKAYLPLHKYFVSKPAGYGAQTENAVYENWSGEGLGILSTLPIKMSSQLNLTSHGEEDPNPRIALHAQVTLDADKLLDVIVVHLSYARQQQCQNARGIVNFMTLKKMKNVVVLGDFNAYENYPAPVEVFTSAESKGCNFKHEQGPHLKDVVTGSLIAIKDMLTFSNMPEPGFVSRPDRILVSKSITVDQITFAGHGVPYQQLYNYIILARIQSFVKTAYLSALGIKGYPCLHDCGPHGSCICGICVAGGNDRNCKLPDCHECDRLSSVLLIVLLSFEVVVSILLIACIIRALVITSRFSQQDLFDILGYRCCMFNYNLFRFPSNFRKLKKGRVRRCLSFFFRMPPLQSIMILIGLLFVLNIYLLSMYSSALQMIVDILPEELFPSDHLMVISKLKV